MALKITDPTGFKEALDKKVKEIDERLIAALKYAGEMFVKECREQPQDHMLGFYKDDTVNLRNSIGYYVFRDGSLLHESDMGNAGVNRQIISSLIEKKGYQLIGIAGMNYASYVEAKGYNVITIQADAVFVRLETYINDIKKFVKSG